MSEEVLARMSALPKVKAVLDALPPKKLELCTGKPPAVVEVKEGRLELATRFERVVDRIRRAKFTGKADEETVPDLFRDYVQRITHALQQAMVVQRLGAASVALDEPIDTDVDGAELSVAVPPTAPLRLTTGQLLLVVADVAMRRDGGEGVTELVCMDGQRALMLMANEVGDGAPPMDTCSQRVLPWRQPTASEVGRLQCCTRANANAHTTQTSCTTHTRRKSARA